MAALAQLHSTIFGLKTKFSDLPKNPVVYYLRSQKVPFCKKIGLEPRSKYSENSHFQDFKTLGSKQSPS